MKQNNKSNKVKKYKLDQEKLRNQALSKGVNLTAPETIFLSWRPIWKPAYVAC